MQGFRWVVILCILITAGCSTSRGFDRGFLKSTLVPLSHNDESASASDQGGAPALQVSNHDIERAFALRPQIPLPFRLAIYLAPEIPEYRRPVIPRRVAYETVKWKWDTKDKEKLLAWGEDLKAKGVLADFFLLPQSRVTDQRLEGIRLATAQHGADALLILTGIADVDRYNNSAAAWYATGIGTFLAHGTNVDALLLLDSALWDVRNAFLYASAESEGMSQRIGTPAIRDHEVVQVAKADAMDALGTELTRRLRALAGKE